MKKRTTTECEDVRFGGHIIRRRDDDESPWIYPDTREEVDWENQRACSNCDRKPNAEGHDACIADLPGVRFACCGHGVEEGYIYFEDGRVIRFQNLYRDDEVED